MGKRARVQRSRLAFNCLGDASVAKAPRNQSPGHARAKNITATYLSGCQLPEKAVVSVLPWRHERRMSFRNVDICLLWFVQDIETLEFTSKFNNHIALEACILIVPCPELFYSQTVGFDVRSSRYSPIFQNKQGKELDAGRNWASWCKPARNQR